ncbi:hypothetical protein OG555_13045 [Kribbella sp. NBC_01484]|uniref:hypothetical protein n=1 Tax=Kribbella sp. NBC_01484 TaxID=2903579 RepID=UPI002E381ADE|nr:hypothetical protein [Kribbella sp. NBC_01484]
MKSRLGRVLAGTFALSATAAALTAGSAFANEPPDGIVWDHTYTAPGVKVYVEEHGDYVEVCDTSKNGYSAWVEVYLGITKYRLTASSGVGTCEWESASDVDLPENVDILLHFDGRGHDVDHPDGVESFYNDH